MPQVSIVLPTRNRPHLLTTALASALRQTYHDFEVVVSDNYCGNDDTKRVADSFDDPRLRYVRTPEPLAMPDSWEFALSNAHGEYITFHTDDCYLLPDAIEVAMAASERFRTQLVSWPYAWRYLAPNWLDPNLRNSLLGPKPVFDTSVVPSADTLKRLFRFNEPLSVPKILNSMSQRQLMEKVIQLQGRFFLPPCPDYSGGVSLLHQIKEYAFVNAPLAISGIFPESIGATQGFNWGESAKNFFGEFKLTSDFDQLVELKVPTLTVCIAQTLENLRRHYPDFPYTIDKRDLVLSSIRDIMRHESNGADVREAWRTMGEYLLRQDITLRRQAALAKLRMRTFFAFKRLRNTRFWGFLESFRGNVVFRGDQCGFRNLQECGDRAGDLFRGTASVRLAISASERCGADRPPLPADD